MKKVVTSGLLLVFSLFLLVGCGKKITTEDLKTNSWLIESTTEDEPDMIASFSDHVMTLKIDSSSIKSTAENEWEELGEEFAKSLVDNLDIKLEYTLDKNVITIQDIENSEEKTYFDVTKEENNIIFTPNKDNDNENLEKMVLKPYEKPTKDKTAKKETKKSTETSTSESNKESSNTATELSTNTAKKETTDNSTSNITATSSNNTYQSILDEYTNKLIAAAPRLAEEYNKEYPSVTTGIDGLAALSNQKVEALAIISNEGVGKMAEIQFNNNSDYSEYEAWAGKLMDVYMNEAQQIMDAYLASATGDIPGFEEYNVPEISEPYYEEPVNSYSEESIVPPVETVPSQQAVAPVEPAAEYITMQPGEGPQQLADRAGISVEQLFQLNGMDPNNFMLAPGDSLRIR